MEENKAYKPDYIENQVNNNCHQFFVRYAGKYSKYAGA